jgi:hypothetical protein
MTQPCTYYTAASQIAPLFNIAPSQVNDFHLKSHAVLYSAASSRATVFYSGESCLAAVLYSGESYLTAILSSGESNLAAV